MKHVRYAFCLALVGLVVPILACAGSADTDSSEPAALAPAASPAEPARSETAATPAGPADQTQASGQPASSQPPNRPKFVAPIRGTADIIYTKPVTKVVKDEVVTTIKLKNTSTGAIAGLRCDEFWADAANNTLPGGSVRLRQPLLPGEEATIELRVPRNPKMQRNYYQFSHANGQIKAKPVPKL